jgi:hypothetical protein
LKERWSRKIRDFDCLRVFNQSVRYTMSIKFRIALILSVLALSLAVLASLPPIPQNLGYHDFADGRRFWIFPNACNVFSNAFFILAGIAGLIRLRTSTHIILWRFFYCSIILVGIGSAYYHSAPTNSSLVFDRIPMAMGFASLVSIVVAERINGTAGRFLLVPLVLAGIGSVVYWYETELLGSGDLRPYIAVQFLPILLIPILIALFPDRKSALDKPLLVLLIGYCIAKLCELEDRTIYVATDHLLSGHTLKHITAALAILLFSRCRGSSN